MTDDVLTVSWSELKTFQRCPKQHQYKYIERLVPKVKQRPLYLGNWVHAALQTHYDEGNWRRGHELYVKDWNSLFEEERLALRTRGKSVSKPFPEIVEGIMKSYLFYYKEDNWEVVATEQEFEVDTPLKIDGKRVRIHGIIDLIIKDENGQMWVIDHKTAGNIPDATAFHAMDPQLMIYPWAAKQAWGYDVQGIFYNYVKSKAPGVPQLLKSGGLSRRKIITDYPTLYRFYRDNGYDPRDFADQLRPLRKRSPFLRRYRYPREAVVTNEILLDSLATAKHIYTDKRRYRVITRDCATMCSYHDLCRAELNGLDGSYMRKNNFTLKPVKVKEQDDYYDEEVEED
jgi:hypothetical protein